MTTSTRKGLVAHDPLTFFTSIRRGSDPKVIAFLLLSIGLLVRLIPALNIGFTQEAPGWEALNVAHSVAAHGRIADAYFAGEGATAHLSPVTPAIAGAIEWLCTPASPLANGVLLCWALAQVLLTYALLFGLALETSRDRLAATIGLALLCLVPVGLWLEIGEFRYWEGAFVSALAIAMLLWLVRQDRRAAMPVRVVILAATSVALIFFINPPVGLALGACWAVACLRRSFRRAVLFSTLAALALGAIVVPWGMRNQRELGRFIPLRSNFGLELAIGYHPEQPGTGDEGQKFARWLDTIHPTAGGAVPVAMVRRWGEVRYAEYRGDQAKQWIHRHPRAAIRLTIAHLVEFFAPPYWFFPVDRSYRLRRLSSLYVSLINLCWLASLCVLAARRRRAEQYVLLFVLVVALPYSIVQPVFRYDYLVTGLLTMTSARLFATGLRRATSAIKVLAAVRPGDPSTIVTAG